MTTPRPLTCTWSAPADGIGRVVIDGDLDYDTADHLLTETGDRLAAEPPLRELWLDCDQLGFCDSYGLSVLLMVHRRALAVGTRLRLARPRHSLCRLLELTGILEYFAVDEGLLPASNESANSAHQ